MRAFAILLGTLLAAGCSNEADEKLAALATRACACMDDACKKKLQEELQPLLKENADKFGDKEENKKSLGRIFACTKIASVAKPDEKKPIDTAGKAVDAADKATDKGDPPPREPAAAKLGLPRSVEVLPRGEATPDTVVVTGDGYLFQVPETFQRIDHPSGAAYSGTVKGFVEPGTLTLWAEVSPFKGNLEALVKREVEAAVKAGASEPSVDTVLFQISSKFQPNVARRMTIRFGDRMELRTVAPHAGKAYVFHCETPNRPNAWANVGTWCITRSLTFHVAPPPLGSYKPDPPGAKGVLFLASKVEGKARDKAVVNPWLENEVVPDLKVCVSKQPKQTTWKITFELAKDGSAGKSTIVGGETKASYKPADDSVASCVAKVIDAAKIKAKAKDVVQVSALLKVDPDL